MTDIIYKLAAHAEALTDLARIRAAQAMLEARDEIVRLRARVEELERPLVPPNWGGPCEYANLQVGSNLCVCGFPMVDHLEHLVGPIPDGLTLDHLSAAHPDVASEVTAKWATPAQGYIFEFASKGRIEFIARAGGSGRGFTDDILILDEAQALTDEHLEALLPALSARSIDGDPQTWYTGSAPDETQHVWQRRRKLWRAGGLATNGRARAAALRSARRVEA